MSDQVIGTLTNKQLSYNWYCPKHKTRKQPYTNKISQTPYFTISRDNYKLGLENAVSMHKIPTEAVDYTAKMIEAFFELDKNLQELTFVSVYCIEDMEEYAAPRISRVARYSKKMLNFPMDDSRSQNNIQEERFKAIFEIRIGEKWISLTPYLTVLIIVMFLLIIILSGINLGI